MTDFDYRIDITDPDTGEVVTVEAVDRDELEAAIDKLYADHDDDL